MRGRLIAITAVVAATALPASATPPCAQGSLPDGRVAVAGCPDAGSSGGSFGYNARLGAYGFNGSLSGDPNGLHATNVPFVAGDVSLDQNGPGLGSSEIFGPTPIDSSLGNGGLTAGFTPDGTVAVLSWPNPSYFNQVKYLTLSRGDARMGAADNMGAFAGIEYAIGHDGPTVFRWLRDLPSTQSYSGGSSNALVTTFEDGSVTVTQTAVVSPREDLLSIHWSVQGAPGAKIVFFENLNPANHKIPWGPGQDQYLWQGSDMAAIWDGHELVHFRADIDPTKLLNLAEGAPDHIASTLQQDLADVSGPLTAFAITSYPDPTAHQVGLDNGGLIREGAPDAGGADAYYDAPDLSGANAAIGQVDAALQIPVDSDGQAYVNIGAAPSIKSAIIKARTKFAAVLRDEEQYWQDWLAGAALPAVSANLDVDRRALIAIKNATASSTGAIVASIARQTPYAEDWTRDGAFFNYALELAGHPEMVAAHNEFYARAQRPNGTWGTMYYADGEEGGPFLYESDQQGLAAWTLWQHYVFSHSKGYLDDVWPAIQRSALWMTNYADPSNGRQGPGEEDDSIFPSMGLQGAVAQWLGLVSAAAAANIEGDQPDAATWRGRAQALKDSILAQYWQGDTFDPGSGGYGQGLGYEGDAGAASWVIWPAGMLDPSIPAERAKLESLAGYLYDYLDANLYTASSLSYEQKLIAALGVYLGAGFTLPGARDPSKVSEWVNFYHVALPTPTLHYGEQIWQVASGQYADRIDMPHVWSGALVYLDAMASTRPDLMPYRPWAQ